MARCRRVECSSGAGVRWGAGGKEGEEEERATARSVLHALEPILIVSLRWHAIVCWTLVRLSGQCVAAS
jgi:hypothetical protein